MSTLDDFVERIREQGSTPPSPWKPRQECLDVLARVADGENVADQLEKIASDHRSMPGGLVEGDVVWAYAELLDALALGVRWPPAVRSAEVEAERFATAARARAADVLARSTSNHLPQLLVQAAEYLDRLVDAADLVRAASSMSRVSLPPRFTEVFRPRPAPSPPISEHVDEADSPKFAVALLLRVNGEAVTRPTTIEPLAINELEVEVRTNDWPDDAQALLIDFVGVLPGSVLDVGSVEILPGCSRDRTHLRLAGHRPPAAGPVELTARAALKTESGAYRPALVVGHPTVELVTFDATTAEPLAMPTASRELHRMMQELRVGLPDLPPDDRADCQVLLESLLRFGQVVREERFQNPALGESGFQRDVRRHLRADPRIGARLLEHGAAAGGYTDLALGNVVLEIKVERERPLEVQQAASLAGQPTQYASGRDRQVSVLCILDASMKVLPAGVMGNDIAWLRPQVHGSEHPVYPSMVAALVIRSGFPRPSDYS